MEGIESKQFEGRLSALTTPNEEGGQASKESRRGGWITFPFITGLSPLLSLIVL